MHQNKLVKLLKLDVKFVTKIILVITLILAFAFVGFVIALAGMSSMAAKDRDLYTHQTLGINYSGGLRDAVNDMQLTVHSYDGQLYAMQLNKSADFPEFDVSEGMSAEESALSGFQKTVDDEDDQKQLDTFNQAFANYKANVTDPIAAATSAKDAAKVHSLIANSSGAEDTLNSAIDSLVSTDTAQAKSESQGNTSESRTLFIVLCCIVGALIAYAVVIEVILARDIGSHFKKLMAASDQIASGDMEIELDLSHDDEFGELNKHFTRLAAAVKALIGDVNGLSAAAIAGSLGTRADVTKHKGDFAKVVEGVNGTLDAIVAPIHVAAENINRIGAGDIPPKITEEYPGEYEEIIDSINNCIDAVNGLVEDSENLIGATVRGRLDMRADASRHRGDFKKIIEGANTIVSTLVAHIDAVPSPVMITDRNFGIEFMNKAGAGLLGLTQTELIGKKCYDMFKTSHCNTKNCACYQAMESGVQASAETDAHPNGLDLDIAYTGVPLKGENGVVTGSLELVMDQTALKNAARVADKQAKFQGAEVTKLIENLGKIAEGNLDCNLTVSETDVDTQEIGSNFEKINLSLGESISALKSIVHDAQELAEAAVEGRLDARADASRHKGGYGSIVEGINNILDAVTEPIKEAAAVLKEVSNGNLQVQVTGNYKGDHAEIKEALNTTIHNLAGYISEISGVLTQISGGNLDIETIPAYKGDFREISVALNHIVDALNDMFTRISIAAEQVSAGSSQVSDGGQALSRGATEQASSIEQLSSSLSDIADRIKRNAEDASQASKLAIAAKDDADRGDSEMSRMLGSMKDISEASVKISKVIKVIDDIAFQTNILSLNAAVEAARAGASGKGFAVVAEEVRNLAARSAAAAKETAELIDGSLKKAEAGSRIADDTAKAFEQIVGSIDRAAALVTEIASASDEQATGIAQINLGVDQVSQVVQTNSATAEESAAASEELSSQAETLKQIVGLLELKQAGKKSAEA